MLFPDFTGVRSLDWLFFVARLGGKKYRSEARMIFSCQPARKGRLACDKAKSYLCREESGISADGYLENRCLFEGIKKRGSSCFSVLYAVKCSLMQS